MMPKTRRKEALRDRANRYTERVAIQRDNDRSPAFPRGLPITSIDVFNAYEDGYRAAMKDARAAYKSGKGFAPLATYNLFQFLKPLK